MIMFSKLYKFFSSVKLAIFLFIAIAALSMVGTFINQADTASQYKTIFGPQVYHILYWLGFLDIYGSWYFIGLAVLLVINLITASASILPHTFKTVFGPYPSFDETAAKKSPKAIYEIIESKKDVHEITKVLNSKLGKPFSEKELYYSKNSIFRLSPFIAHFSVIIIIIGVFLNFHYGFRSYTNIKVGEKTNISYLSKNHKPIKLPFTLSLDNYRTLYYKDGIPKSYISKISIIKNHVAVATKNIKVNHPFTYGGITIYQASYGHYKPTAAKLSIVSLKNRKSEKIVYAEFGKLYDTGINNIKFRFIPYKHPKKDEIPFFIELSNNKILKFYVLPYKKHSMPLIFAKYQNTVFLYNGVKNYYYSGVEITKNAYTSVIWAGSIILIIALFFSFFFNHTETWVKLTPLKDGKKTRIEILAVPKKKFESFYNKFNKLIAGIKKDLTGE